MRPDPPLTTDYFRSVQMNVKQLIAAVAVFAAAGAAVAGPNEGFFNDSSVSSKTRAEVRAELEQARLQGQLHQGESYKYPDNVRPVSVRAAVRSEAAQNTALDGVKRG